MIIVRNPSLKLAFAVIHLFKCSAFPSMLHLRQGNQNFDPLAESSNPAEDIFRNDIIRKKVNIIIVILSFCVVCAIILSFVNTHDDFLEMSNFYHGYMGRRLLIQEKRLVYRTKLQQIDRDLKNKTSNSPPSRRFLSPHMAGVNFMSLDESLSPTSTLGEQFAISPLTTTTILPSGVQHDLTDEQSRLPEVRRFVEDEEPEWRGLDYEIPVGKPPATFYSFIKQYDWHMFSGDGLTAEEIQEQKNLLNQFRKWKKRKRKTFNVIVTDRAKREMAEQEEEKNKKRTPPSK